MKSKIKGYNKLWDLVLDVFRKKKLHKEASSIGIIGGSDGPTSVYFSGPNKNNNQEDKWNQLLQTCKEITVPKSDKITGEEIKNYLIDKYDAREIELPSNSKQSLKYNLIMNYYPEALQELEALQGHKDMGYFDQFNNIELISDEKLKLNFSSLIISRTSKTESLYQEFEQEINEHIYRTKSLFSRIFKKSIRKTLKNIKEIKFEIELSTGYMQFSNGPKSLMDEIILWKGVTQEDIDNSTPAFMSYAAAMGDTGKIRIE